MQPVSVLGLIAVLLVISAAAVTFADEPDRTSCAAVCRDHPDDVRRLFAELDLDRPGLEQVKAAVGRSDYPAACEALIAYYRNGKTAQWHRFAKTPNPTTRRDSAGDALLNDTFTFQAVTAVQPRRKNGGLDWHDTGPHHDGEWAIFINRHQWFSSLLGAWRRTGNSEYPACFDYHLRDWIESNPVPEGKNHYAPWRELEVGIRLSVWPAFFYGFQQADAFTSAGRILMLSSVPNHARRCQMPGGNWGVIMARGLAHAATCWPEFKDSSAWFDRASAHLTRAIGTVCLADGVQREMSYSYHHACVTCFEPLVDLADKLGRELPPKYQPSIRRMWEYSIYSLRPDGYCPLTGDSDLRDEAATAISAAERYKRDDWLFAASKGLRGTRPAGPASRAWPDSGQFVMRSDWTAEAQWAYFDAGPLGGWHGHFDNLHLSVFAFGRPLLVDGGRYWYKGDDWRSYFKSSAAHNVILVDGQGQNDSGGGTNLAGRHEINPGFDYVRGDHATGFGEIKDARHTRTIVYLRGLCWVVFDRVAVEQPRTIEPLWHFAPECAIAADGLAVESLDDGKGNLRILPVGGPDWKLDIVKGQGKPAIQGWHSPTYNVKLANPTAVYKATIDKPMTFAWVLVPGRGQPPAVHAEMLPAPEHAGRLKLTLPGNKHYDLAIRMSGDKAIRFADGLTLEGNCAIVGPE